MKLRDNNVPTATVKISNTNIKFKLVTGVQCNVLPYRVYKKLNINNEICKGNNYYKAVITYGNNKINTKGVIILPCVINNLKFKIKCVVLNVKNGHLFLG